MTEQPFIVLDANAFINGTGLLQLGPANKLVTTAEVLDELRDPKTREMLDKFVFTIDEMEPLKVSLEAVRDFAKKTGDLSSLSDVDIGLLALAHTLYVSKGLGDKLRKAPLPAKSVEDLDNNKHYSSSESDPEDSSEEEQIKEAEPETKQAVPAGKQQVKPEKEDSDKQPKEQWIVVPVKKHKKKQESDEDLDDDEGWVTPSNYEQKIAEGTTFFNKLKQESEEEESQDGIYLITSDFAMQNVAIQMGIPLKSLDGRRVREVRRFILECYLCWKTYKVEDNKIRLCKECGYNSLSKIAYSLTPEGMILHRKKGWKPNQKVLEWKEKKYEEQQRKKKHQHARRKKQASIFEV